MPHRSTWATVSLAEHLRHASLTLDAHLGATTAELMRRAGHASARAAQHYQHAAESRDKDLAALLSQLDRAGGHTEGTGTIVG